MARTIILAIAVIACVASLLQNTAAETTHVVGGDLGWQIPPGGAIAYVTWASMQTFSVGDILRTYSERQEYYCSNSHFGKYERIP